MGAYEARWLAGLCYEEGSLGGATRHVPAQEQGEGLLLLLAGRSLLALAMPFSLVQIEHIAILIFDQG